MIKCSNISGNGLETAGWIDTAFSSTNTGFKMVFPNTCYVLRIAEHDVYSNQLQKKNKNQNQTILLCILQWQLIYQLISAHDKVPYK